MESQIKRRDKQFSGVYSNFTYLFSQSQMQEEEQRVRIPEKVLRFILNDQSIKTDELPTVNRKVLEAIFPGYLNFGGICPDNYPYGRMAGLSHLLVRH